jgi:hypothetical protein
LWCKNNRNFFRLAGKFFVLTQNLLNSIFPSQRVVLFNEVLFFIFTAYGLHRTELGLPADWKRIENWLFSEPAEICEVKNVKPTFNPKHPDIPVLQDYSQSAGPDFWSEFPKNIDSCRVSTPIKVKRLSELIDDYSVKMTSDEKLRASKVLLSMKKGADSLQTSVLKGCVCPNGESAVKHGATVTDTIATWVENDFVCGPFDSPPFSDFRCNKIIAIVQPTKIRPCLDLSSPEGSSFNDNINCNLLEKVFMATEKDFGYVLKESGYNAKMSKFDTCDAYKCVPVPLSEFRLQGFIWLKKFFFEKKQVFGSKAAVPNYDRFGNTIKTLACIMSKIPSKFVLRCLDDVPVVAPAGSNLCENFSQCYKDICDDCNIRLAPECPKKEKAFVNQTAGKVLGIWFDSKDLTWQYPEEKRVKALQIISKCLKKNKVSLENFQKLLGRLNDFMQMCPFLKVFKHNLNACMSDCIMKGDCVLTDEALYELKVWANCIFDNVLSLPIPSRPSPPPVQHRCFISDAAGVSDLQNFSNNEGVGGVGFDEEGKIISAYQVLWNESFISFVDNKGAHMGSKTTTLEIIGVLLHVLLFPELVKNRIVVFETDNMACYFGWQNKYVKEDAVASIIVRALALLEPLLNSEFHIQHVPRMSSWEACVVDRLSRKSTTTLYDVKLVKSFKCDDLPECMSHWLINPSEDWELPLKIVKHVSYRFMK